MTAISKHCEVCSKEYTPYNKQQKYCSRQCQNKSKMKKYNVEAFRLKRRNMINNIKLEVGCSICGYNEHPAALHFDHIDPSLKSFTISQDVKKKWEDIINEINKCRVLCANCHAIHTHKENHYRNNR
jgi:predicted nucleic acid-binding Zn ribbon protein